MEISEYQTHELRLNPNRREDLLRRIEELAHLIESDVINPSTKKRLEKSKKEYEDELKELDKSGSSETVH